MAESNISEYLTLAEVSKMLKVHPNTLRNWDKNGVLKAKRLGQRKLRRYKKSDVLDFIENNQ